MIRFKNKRYTKKQNNHKITDLEEKIKILKKKYKAKFKNTVNKFNSVLDKNEKCMNLNYMIDQKHRLEPSIRRKRRS